MHELSKEDFTQAESASYLALLVQKLNPGGVKMSRMPKPNQN